MNEISSPSENTKYSAPESFMMTLGFGLVWAVVFLITYSIIFSGQLDFGGLYSNGDRVTMLFGIAACHTVIALVGAKVDSLPKRRTLAFWGLLSLGLFLAGFFASSNFGWSSPFLALFWLFVGVWQGIFVSLWAELLTLSFGKSSLARFFESTFMGAVLFTIAAQVDTSTGIIIGLLFALLSYGLYLLTSKDLVITEYPPKENATEGSFNKEERSFIVKSSTIFFACSVVFGVALGSSTRNVLTLWNTNEIGIALGCGVLLICILMSLTKKIPTFSLLMRIIIPFAALALCFIQAMDANGQWYGWILLLTALTVFDSTQMGFQAGIVDNTEMNPLRIISFGRASVQIGLFVGALIDLLVSSIFSSVFNMNLLPGLLVIVMIGALFLSGSYRFPDLSEIITEDLVVEPVPLAVDSWEHTRQNIIKRYNLTSREGEVFDLLSKGHNAGSIADRLYISRSTSKTHIFHIYRKLGIASQQELINLAEEERRKV